MDHYLILCDENGNQLKTYPSVPGLESLRKSAREHKGVAFYFHETSRTALINGRFRRFFYYDYCDVYRNGVVVKTYKWNEGLNSPWSDSLDADLVMKDYFSR